MRLRLRYRFAAAVLLLVALVLVGVGTAGLLGDRDDAGATTVLLVFLAAGCAGGLGSFCFQVARRTR